VRYVAAITRGRKGRELSDMVELAAAGAIAFSDDGSPVEDSHLFRSALEYARVTGRPVIEHAQDLALSAKGVMHEGSVSARLGLPGMPAAAEESAVARDIALARMTGANLHLTHLSTAGSIELVRRAKADGVPVTCDVTPHHLAMTDEWVAGSRARAWEVGGEAFGDGQSASGEVVFNTAMTGYQEIASDASYNGQIVVLTYPLIGNYGTFDRAGESRRPWVEGLIVRELVGTCREGTIDLDAYLRSYGAPGLAGIDTR